MKYPIEYNGQCAIVQTATVTVDCWQLASNAGDCVTVCSWCPNADKTTQLLIVSGYKVSHGICDKCAEKMGCTVGIASPAKTEVAIIPHCPRCGKQSTESKLCGDCVSELQRLGYKTN